MCYSIKHLTGILIVLYLSLGNAEELMLFEINISQRSLWDTGCIVTPQKYPQFGLHYAAGKINRNGLYTIVNLEKQMLPWVFRCQEEPHKNSELVFIPTKTVTTDIHEELLQVTRTGTAENLGIIYIFQESDKKFVGLSLAFRENKAEVPNSQRKYETLMRVARFLDTSSYKFTLHDRCREDVRHRVFDEVNFEVNAAGNLCFSENHTFELKHVFKYDPYLRETTRIENCLCVTNQELPTKLKLLGVLPLKPNFSISLSKDGISLQPYTTLEQTNGAKGITVNMYLQKAVSSDLLPLSDIFVCIYKPGSPPQLEKRVVGAILVEQVENLGDTPMPWLKLDERDMPLSQGYYYMLTTKELQLEWNPWKTELLSSIKTRSPGLFHIVKYFEPTVATLLDSIAEEISPGNVHVAGSLDTRLSVNSRTDADNWIHQLSGQLCRVRLTKGLETKNGYNREWFFVRFSDVSYGPVRCNVYFHEVKLGSREYFMLFESAELTWSTTVVLVTTQHTPKYLVRINPPQDVKELMTNGTTGRVKLFLWTDVIANTGSTYDLEEYKFEYYRDPYLMIEGPMMRQGSSEPLSLSAPRPITGQSKPTFDNSKPYNGLVGSTSNSVTVPLNPTFDDSKPFNSSVGPKTTPVINRPSSVVIPNQSSSSSTQLATTSSVPTTFNFKCAPIAFLSVNGSEEGKWVLKVFNDIAWQNAGVEVYQINSHSSHICPARIPKFSEISSRGFIVQDSSGKTVNCKVFRAAKTAYEDTIFLKGPTLAEGYIWHQVGTYYELQLSVQKATLCENESIFKDATVFTTRAYSSITAPTHVPKCENAFVVTSITNGHSVIDPVDYEDGLFKSHGGFLWFQNGTLGPRVYIHVYLLSTGAATFIGTLVVNDEESGSSSNSEGYLISLYYKEQWTFITEAKSSHLRFVVSSFIVPRQYSEIAEKDKQIYKKIVETRLYLT